MNNGLRVVYILESDDMTDGEYEDQEEQEFVISDDLVKSLIERYTIVKDGHYIDWGVSHYKLNK